MATKHKMPGFKSEQEEAAWWDAHPEVIAELFLKARKEGRIKRLPVVRGATKPVTIRMPVGRRRSCAGDCRAAGRTLSDVHQRALAQGVGTRVKGQSTQPPDTLGKSTITPFHDKTTRQDYPLWTGNVRDTLSPHFAVRCTACIH
jgi:hypothetical protein